MFIGTACLILYVIALPYLCRLPQGSEWAEQYPSMLSVVFSQSVPLALCSSLPSIPLVATFLLVKHIPITFAVSIFTTTALLAVLYYDYPFEDDGQSALGLVFIPLYTLPITAVVAGLSGICEFFWWRIRAQLQD